LLNLYLLSECKVNQFIKCCFFAYFSSWSVTDRCLWRVNCFNTQKKV